LGAVWVEVVLGDYLGAEVGDVAALEFTLGSESSHGRFRLELWYLPHKTPPKNAQEPPPSQEKTPE
jgi:hypothetical protein